MIRIATCHCGALRVSCEGEPVRLSMCHCLDCQRRTGSAYGFQARFPRSAVTIEGAASAFTRKADSGNDLTFHFCPTCGSTVYWDPVDRPDLIAVAVGAFADPTFPPPKISIYEVRCHPWAIPALPMEHLE